MTKEDFKNIILEIIGTQDESVFNKFIDEVGTTITGKQALKLDGIGYFQKRKEPLSRMERKMSGNVGEKEILLFKPEDETGEESILSFDLTATDEKDDEFNESVFDIGIDKPTIISDDGDENIENSENDLDENLLAKINEFVGSGEVIQEFELLDEHESASDEEGKEESAEEEAFEEVASQEFTEAEINKEFLINDTDDEYEETSSNLEPEITEEDVKNSEEEGISDEQMDDSQELHEEESDANPFDELENYIVEDSEVDAEEIINSEPDEELEEEEKVIKEEVEHEPIPEKKKAYTNFESNKWYKNPILYIASLSLIVAIAVVFFFWPKDEEQIVENQLSENHSSEVVQKDSLLNNESLPKEKSHEEVQKTEEESKPEQIKEKVVKESEPVKEVEKPKSKVEKKATYNSTALYRDIKNDQTITQRIYFDGEKYMVQASSWRSTSIAEREVKKLRKRGFDAFIYKVFIKSKNGTWNRVRIGYFDSKKEAEEFLKKNKI